MGRGGGLRVEENPNPQILQRQNLCHFLTMSEQIMHGWQDLLMRNSGQLLLFAGGLWMVAVISWRTFRCINQHSCLHPIECHRNTTNEERQLQHFCDFHGKVIIINQVLWHGTNGQRHGLTDTRANP